MAITIPKSVTRDEFNEAVKPLLNLIGVPSAYDCYDDPGIVIADQHITLTVAGQVDTDATAHSVTVGESEFRERATEVHVRIA